GRCTVTNANFIQVLDRVFHMLGAANGPINVEFHNVTIQNGVALDDGTAGAVAGDTDSHGGGILNDSGAGLLLDHATVTNNSARGFNGANGPPGGDGDPGLAAAGGGIYSTTAGALTLTRTNGRRDGNQTAPARHGATG